MGYVFTNNEDCNDASGELELRRFGMVMPTTTGRGFNRNDFSVFARPVTLPMPTMHVQTILKSAAGVCGCGIVDVDADSDGVCDGRQLQ